MVAITSKSDKTGNGVVATGGGGVGGALLLTMDHILKLEIKSLLPGEQH